ncbi:DUF7373 family lipoprotein [Mycolicibacterium neoaurum]|uniref:DUF7373 family lipoprotein n=1 Tax=Mycolicibacterium neoaurum TaxID=1795 RepID=UPI00056D67F6
MGVFPAAVGTAAVMVILTGCASPQPPAPGGPAASTPQTSLPPIVGAAQLDAGRYPTAPRPPLGRAGDPKLGAVVDAQRLADHVVGPWEANRELISPYLSTFYLLDAPTQLSQFSPDSVAQRAQGHGFVNGFASAREAPDKAIMINAVMRFPDTAAAQAAATDMNSATAEQSVRGATPVPATIPGHPETLAFTYPFTPTGSDRPWAVIRSFTPHGPFVFMQLTQSADGLDAAAMLVQKVVELQGPRVDKFAPADPGALAEVELDPTGLLAKTLPAESNPSSTKNAVYDERGAMHFQTNPLESKTLFSDTGVTAVAMAAASVYQARNPGSALMIVNAFSKEILNQGAAVEPVPQLPESHCATRGKSFYCVALAGEYAVEVNGDALPDVHQRTAAQYILLTAG